MPKQQIAVLDQRQAKGTENSCGFHAIKNALLGLLLQQESINQKQYSQLSQSKVFFEALYDQVSPNRNDPTIDLSRAQVNEGIEKLKSGQCDLSAFGLSNEMLTGLDYSQLTVFNIPFGYEANDIGAFGDDTLANALSFVQLAKQDGPFSHVFALGGSFPPSYDGHWVNVYMEVTEDNQRHYTFMDSYGNQHRHFQTMVKGVEDIMVMDNSELDRYFLDVYDSANFQFDDLYHRFFDLEGNVIPNDGVLVQDSRHEDQMIPRGCFDDSPLTHEHEWIDATEFTKRHGDTWASSAETKFNALQSAGLLKNPSEQTQVYINQLLDVSGFIEQVPGMSQTIVSKMGSIRETLQDVVSDLEQQLDDVVEPDSQDEIVIQINSQPKVNPMDIQIRNLTTQITKLEKSIDVSLGLIEGLAAKEQPKPNEMRLLQKAQSGLMKKLSRLDSLTHNRRLAEAHQQKYSPDDRQQGVEDKHQSLREQLKQVREDSSPKQEPKHEEDITLSSPSNR